MLVHCSMPYPIVFCCCLNNAALFLLLEVAVAVAVAVAALLDEIVPLVP